MTVHEPCSDVLAGLNVSSVAPYPESAVPYVVDASVAQVQTARQRRFSARGKTF